MSHTTAQTTMVTSQKLSTFDQILALDPSLICLLRRARNQKGNCANSVWYGKDGLRAEMTRVIGHQRTHGPSELKTSAAYDVAYRTLYAALPDCKGCGCLSLEDVL
jgi:hypothetical protein